MGEANMDSIKPFLWILVVFGLVLGCTSICQADEWRTSDTYREAGFQVLNLIDWGQTRYIAQHPDKFKEVESAWIIGEHPSVQTVDNYMLFSAVVHPIVSYYLPHGWRDAWQYITIGGKINATANNATIGIKVSF
jgi:hypothetical protein